MKTWLVRLKGWKRVEEGPGLAGYGMFIAGLILAFMMIVALSRAY
jgi:hypothetical protein